jgi:hypothetical protein
MAEKEYSRKNTEFVEGIEAHRKDIGLFGSDKVSGTSMYNSPRRVTKVRFSFSARAVQLLVPSVGQDN